MRVWYPVPTKGQHIIHVTPANDPEGKEVSEFVDGENKPLQFSVVFAPGGRSLEISDALGKYLIAKKLARKMRPLLQQLAAE
jgi:hypothetical protein